ncbi:MAG: hypothetical protein QNJ87_15745 [Gammaproteobacteria bacterium]|nr:hypothetical protein [Gammaproteobacteria bacterium]MDJ0891391.1 hypothetical protein [Gammaproteobacteria bacterium]
MQQAPRHHALGPFTNNLQELTTEQLQELTDYLEQRLGAMGADGASHPQGRRVSPATQPDHMSIY